MQKARLVVAILIAILMLSLTLIPRSIKGVPSGLIDVPGDYAKIQDAINAANSGDTIVVHSGIYNEALYISKSLTMLGVGNPVVNGSGAFTTSYRGSSFSTNAVIGVVNSTIVSIEGFEIEGFGLGTGRSNGVVYIYSGGELKNCTVSPNTVGSSGVGAMGVEARASYLNVTRCKIENFGRIGVYFANVTGGVYNSTIIGQVYSGENDVNYGVEIEPHQGICSVGVTGNNIYDCDNSFLPSPSWSSAAILVDINRMYYDVAPSMVSIARNDIHNNFEAIEVVSNSMLHANYNNIRNNKYGVWTDPDYYNNNETFDTRSNWWGDASGPNQTMSNPGGSGNDAGDYVHYSPWLGAVVGTSPMTYNVNPSGTIQEAIDAASPGDTITVHSGTYNENQLVINKALNVVGAGADTTIIDGQDASLTTGGLVRITATAGNVLFSGFTLRNAGTDPSGGRFGIVAYSASSGPTYTISYNKIYGTNNPDDYNDYGFYTHGGKEHLIFAHNLITQTGANPVLIEQHLGPTDIVYNTLDVGVWGSDSIFYMTYGGQDITTLQNVSYNTFDMGTGGPFDYDHRATGISFCSVYPALGSPPEAKFTNMVISGNIFNNLRSYRRGIGFWNAGTGNNLVSPTITGNTINGVTGSTGSYGIDFYGLVSNAMITGNTIQDTDTAIGVRSGSAPGTVINYNNIVGNTVGIDWTLGPPDVDTRFNWWGSATGPYDPVYNPSGTGDKIVGKVAFEPWLVSSYPPATPVEALIYVNPVDTEYWTVSYGKTFTLDVKLDNVTNLYGYEFKLYWNTTLLNLVGVQITPPWSAYTIGKNETRADLGRYWLGVAGVSPMPPFSGSTTLARLTFQIVYDPIYPANETCALNLADTILSEPLGVPIYHMVHGGTYSIYSTEPKIKVDPSIYTAHALGEVFKVNITVSDVVNLYNYTFKLDYNTTLLDATNLEIGPFLNSPIYTYKFVIDDANGLVWLWVWSTGGASPASGSGVVATITFKATTATLWRTTNPNILSCPLHLHDTLLVTDSGVSVAHLVSDGTYYYAPKPGDLNYDGHVGLVDLRTVGYYYDPVNNPIADLNQDGKVNILDLTIVSYHYGEDC